MSLAHSPLRNLLTGSDSKNDARSITVVVTKGDEKDSFDIPRIILHKVSKVLKSILKELAPGAPLLVNNVKPASLADVLQYLYDGSLYTEKVRDGYDYDRVEEIWLDVCVLAGRWDIKELFNEALEYVEIGFGHTRGESQKHRRDLIARTNQLYFDMSGPPNLRQYMAMLVALRPFNKQAKCLAEGDDKKLSESEHRAQCFMSDLENFISNDSLPSSSCFAKRQAEEDITAREDREMAKSAAYHTQFIKIVLHHGEKGLKNRYQYRDWALFMKDGLDDLTPNRTIKGRNVPFVSSIHVEQYYLK